MVAGFKIAKSPELIFGLGSIHKLPDLIKNLSPHIVLITGKGTLSRNPQLADVINKIKVTAHSFQTFTISKEPSPQNIDDIVQIIPAALLPVVIAIGGGSVVDAGKAISAMIPIGESIIDYLEVIGTKTHPGTKTSFIAIPTTSGTGSEASANAVISRVGADGFKRSLRHDHLVPDQVILDPELTFSCSPEVTAFSGMDAITQLIEAYVSTKSNRYIQSLIEGAVTHIDEMLLRAIANGQNAEARAKLQYAAYISGIALANCGLGMVHGFASELGGSFDIPHGLVCAKLAAHSHQFNIEKAINENNTEVIHKYAHLYQSVTGTQDGSFANQAALFAQMLMDLSTKLNLPGFSKYDITPNHLPNIAKQSGIKNNPIDVTNDEKIEILMKCL
jgi:alcohol dehydrogenase class IV